MPQPLGRAYDALDPVLAVVWATAPDAQAVPVGAMRRGLDAIDHVALLVLSRDAAALVVAIGSAFPDHRPDPADPRSLQLTVDRVTVDVTCTTPADGGIELLFRTGPRDHLAALHLLALERGLTLDRRGLHTPAGPVRETETAIYAALGLPCIPPELRDDREAIGHAAARALPALVTEADIRGDLHCHTHWSDGRDSIEAMVMAAVGLGYEYLAITDHSQNSAAVRSLTIDGVARQAEELARVREDYPGITILHGCEVDILEDGALDFPDRVLEQFDVVLASLHESHGHAPETLLRRYERAMRHPLVSIITHPTNRLVPHRAGYALDYDRLFELAVETGTLLEVDGAPSHLDLDAALARRAVGAGVRLTIDSDCHRADRLGRQMQLGLLTARRGWVEAAHVLNTRPLHELRAAVAAKRAGGAVPDGAC